MEMIGFWWALFGGTHLVGSSLPVRSWAIDRLGRAPFKGVYSLVALATFIPLVQSYQQHRGEGMLFFTPLPELQWVTMGLVLLAFILLMQGLATPTPMSTQTEMSGVRVDEARGVHRVTRHSQNWAFALFALGHMLARPYASDWVFWGGFVLFAWISAVHQDHRLLAEERDGFGPFKMQTSLIPFGAIFGGRNRIVWREWSWPALLMGVVLTGGLCYFHSTLFGGAPGWW